MATTSNVTVKVTLDTSALVAQLRDLADRLDREFGPLNEAIEGMDRSGKPLDADRNGRIDSTEG